MRGRGVVGLVLLASLWACRPAPRASPLPGPTPSPPAPAPVEEPLYLALIWHQHQPFYPKDPQTGLYTRP